MINTYTIRRERNRFEKRCIGVYTAYYLRHNARYQPIAVDGGSTNFHVLDAICRDANAGRETVSQVLTNHLEGIYLALQSPGKHEIPLIWNCTGGVLRVSHAVFVEGAHEAIKDYPSWMAVVGINGFQSHWLQTSTQREQMVKKAMVQKAANAVIFPFDSSKWGHPAGMYLLTLDEIVSWRKKAVVVTCLPVQEQDESSDAFTDRLRNTVSEISKLTREWQYQINVFVAPVDPDNCEFEDQAIPLVNGFVDEEDLLNAYRHHIAPAEARHRGLIVRLDLWSDANP